MRTFRKYLVSLASAALVLGSLAATGTASAATIAGAPFSDVTSSTQYANAINFLYGLGIINGTSTGVFQPTTPVTRAEMAKIVVLDAGKGNVANSLASMTPTFSDASSIPTWAWGYVNAAVAMGVIKGFPDGTFRANDNVTDAEALAMFTRALGDDWSVTGTWPNNYVLAGYNLAIANGLTSMSANVPALRGEIAQMAYNAAVNALYTTVNSNGTNALSSGGGLFTKNEASGGNGSVFPENVVGTVTNASANSITIQPTGFGVGCILNATGTACTNTSSETVAYGFEPSVTLINATALDSSLNGDSVTAIVDSNDLVSVIDVSTATTTAADTLNSSGDETTNFSLPAGYSLPTGSGNAPTSATAVPTSQAQANTGCDETPGSAGGTFNTVGCNPNNTHDHPLVVQDSSGNNYLLMSDGKTIEYNNLTQLTLNGTSEGTLNGNENWLLVPGATISATLSNGLASAITETATYTANLVQAVDPNTGVVTITNGGSPQYVNASSATITLNGQPSTLSAIEPNDAVDVVPAAPALSALMAAGTSLFDNTLKNSTTSGVSVNTLADTRNTVTGSITSTSTSTIAVSVSEGAYTYTTITLQPSSGNAVTLTTDGDQPSSQYNALTAGTSPLQEVNASVTLALDSGGGILDILSTSASAIPVAMLTGTGSVSSSVNGSTTSYVTLTGIAGPSTTTYDEAPATTTQAQAFAPSGMICWGATGAATLPCTQPGATTAQADVASPDGTGWTPSTVTDGFNNFWALTTNASGQVSQATYMNQVVPQTQGGQSGPDTFQVVSASSSAVTVEAINPSGSVDTTYSSDGFGSGYLTVTSGTAFSGVTGQKYIGFTGLVANDVVNLYYGPTSSTGGSTPVYAIVDTYR